MASLAEALETRTVAKYIYRRGNTTISYQIYLHFGNPSALKFYVHFSLITYSVSRAILAGPLTLH